MVAAIAFGCENKTKVAELKGTGYVGSKLCHRLVELLMETYLKPNSEYQITIFLSFSDIPFRHQKYL